MSGHGPTGSRDLWSEKLGAALSCPPPRPRSLSNSHLSFGFLAASPIWCLPASAPSAIACASREASSSVAFCGHWRGGFAQRRRARRHSAGRTPNSSCGLVLQGPPPAAQAPKDALLHPSTPPTAPPPSAPRYCNFLDRPFVCLGMRPRLCISNAARTIHSHQQLQRVRAPAMQSQHVHLLTIRLGA